MALDDVIVSSGDVSVQERLAKKLMAAVVVKWLLANIEHVWACAEASDLAKTNL